MKQPFEYWVNVYQGFVDMGGMTKDEADVNNSEMWEAELKRIDCRLLRYVPGKGFKDVTPKVRRTRNVSPEVRARAAERLRQYHRKKQEAK